MKTSVAVVGGGASGMVAALAAARRGCRVVLLERSAQLGRKVLASGGGRCNLGNARVEPARYHSGPGTAGAAGELVRRVLSRFGPREAERFFQGLGLLLATEADGRVFPRTGQARSVLAVLEAALAGAGVEVRLEREVSSLKRSGRGFAVGLPGGERLEADRVVLCCGGLSYPQLGGGDRGLALARSLGLRVVEPTPSLVPLVSRDPWVRRLQGIRVQAMLSVREEACSAAGELLFTAYGLSGPAALDVSRRVARALPGRAGLEARVNFLPEYSASDLRRLFHDRLRTLKPPSAEAFLRGVLPDRVAKTFLAAHPGEPRLAGPPGPEAADLMAGIMGGWSLSLCGHRPWDEAMACAGGVALDQVSPDTLESRGVPGLHLAGELLDVDGDSGGFNLHFAWATGHIAGSGAGV